MNIVSDVLYIFAVSLAVYQIYLLPSFFPEDKVSDRGHRVIAQQRSFPSFQELLTEPGPHAPVICEFHTPGALQLLDHIRLL